jgi:hypothetical protein
MNVKEAIGLFASHLPILVFNKPTLDIFTSFYAGLSKTNIEDMKNANTIFTSTEYLKHQKKNK